MGDGHFQHGVQAAQHFRDASASDEMKFVLGQPARDGQGARHVPEHVAHHSVQGSCHDLAEVLLIRTLWASPRGGLWIGFQRGGNRMAAYRIWRVWVALFLAGYFALGFSTLALPRGEVFPCFSWFLFALVPGRESQYAVRLQEVRGQKLAEPVLFQIRQPCRDSLFRVQRFVVTRIVPPR
ncbi:MAG: hypothetical protein ABSD58_00010 [Verrucomicrobiia bacterium]|jgi:hypothetical protein